MIKSIFAWFDTLVLGNQWITVTSEIKVRNVVDYVTLSPFERHVKDGWQFDSTREDSSDGYVIITMHKRMKLFKAILDRRKPLKSIGVD